jgi:hypothetical protein
MKQSLATHGRSIAPRASMRKSISSNITRVRRVCRNMLVAVRSCSADHRTSDLWCCLCSLVLSSGAVRIRRSVRTCTVSDRPILRKADRFRARYTVYYVSTFTVVRREVRWMKSNLQSLGPQSPDPLGCGVRLLMDMNME